MHGGTFDSGNFGLDFVSHHAAFGSIAILTWAEDSLHSKLTWYRLQKALRTPIENVAWLLNPDNRGFDHRSQLLSA
jgi:hypothetical protein